MHFLRWLLLAVLAFAPSANAGEDSKQDWTSDFNRGQMAYRERRYADAQHDLLQALQQARDTDQPALRVAEILEALSNTALTLQHFDAALAYLDERVRLLRHDPSSKGSLRLSQALTSLAVANERVGNFDAALSALRESRTLEGAMFAGGWPIADSEMRLARHFQRRGDHERAERHYREAIAAMDQTPNDQFLALVLEGYSALLVEMRRHDEAASALQRAGAVRRATETSAIPYRIDSTRNEAD